MRRRRFRPFRKARFFLIQTVALWLCLMLICLTSSGLTQGETVVLRALEHLGKPYVLGAAGPDRFDCSGLVMYCLEPEGFEFPYHAAAIIGTDERYPLITDPRALLAGDVVCFDTVRDKDPSDHMGFWIGGNRFVHASSTGEVKVSALEDFYLEKDRVYRSELNVFDDYTEGERIKFFGEVPRTVWENMCAFDKYPEKLEIFKRDDVMTEMALTSYKEAVLGQWAMELQGRIVPETMELLRHCRKMHKDEDCVDYDRHYWGKFVRLRNYLGKNTLEDTCLLTHIVDALEAGDYAKASELQIEMQEKVEEMRDLYVKYRKNLF